MFRTTVMFAMAAICAAATSEKRSNLKVNCKGNLEIVPPAKGAVEVNGKILCDQLSAESIVSPEIKAATDTATNAAAVAEQSAAAAAALELQLGAVKTSVEENAATAVKLTDDVAALQRRGVGGGDSGGGGGAATSENTDSIKALTDLVTTLVAKQTDMLTEQKAASDRHDAVVVEMKSAAAQQTSAIQTLTTQLAMSGLPDGEVAFPGMWGKFVNPERTTGMDWKTIYLVAISTDFQESLWAAKFAGRKVVEANVEIRGGDPARISRILKDVEVVIGGITTSSYWAVEGTLRFENLRMIHCLSSQGCLEIDGASATAKDKLLGIDFPELISAQGLVTIRKNTNLKTISLPKFTHWNPDLCYGGCSFIIAQNNPGLDCSGVAKAKTIIGTSWRGNGGDYPAQC